MELRKKRTSHIYRQLLSTPHRPSVKENVHVLVSDVILAFPALQDIISNDKDNRVQVLTENWCINMLK